MYTVKSDKPNAIAWDGKANEFLCRFKNGIFETDNKQLADRLSGMGYHVDGLKKQEEAPADDLFPPDEPAADRPRSRRLRGAGD